VEEPKATLLIIEDDVDITEMLHAYFTIQEYNVIISNWGEDGLHVCQEKLPDLVILDIRLPDIDGFEVARRLRANRRTRDLPIIFLTEKKERSERLKGLALNADDYITKPFDVQELRLRVRNTLQRSKRSSLTNPITHLPEGNLVDENLTRFLSATDSALIVVALKNLNQFREVYGFVAADDLLRAIALIMMDLLQEKGSPEDFLGHLSPQDFVIITKPQLTIQLKDQLQKRLNQSFDKFYSDKDRETGIFGERLLKASINDVQAGQKIIHNLSQLKTRLEKLYKQSPK
jgi:DNA-binding response OmpR family regulator